MQKWFFRAIITAIIFCLCIGSVSAATQQIVNGDFDNGLYGWQTDEYISTSSGSIYSTTTYGDLVVSFSLPSGRENAYFDLYQSVDVSYVDDITITLQGTHLYVNNIAGVEVYLGYNQVLDIDSTTLDLSTPSTYTIDTSGYFGTQELLLRFNAISPLNNNLNVDFQVSSVSAISNERGPSYISSSLSDNLGTTSKTFTADFTISGGIPASTDFVINWGDGKTSSSNVNVYSSYTFSRTHTYSSPGTYTVTASASNDIDTITQIIGTVEIIALDFTAYPTTGDPPLSVQFSLSAQNIETVLWDFGDGSTSTVENPVHTYAASSTPYTVTLTGYTASGNSFVVPKSNYITASAQTLLWNATSYESGDTASITWELRDPDFANYQYTLQILASDSQGNTAGSSIITPYTVNTVSGTYTWNTAGASGYYTAAIFRSGTASPIVFATTNIITQATLTVNLATNGVTYTNATTVSVSQNGVIVATQTTTSGQVQFTIPTGAYIVQATTTGYATQQATVNLLESTAVTIDFVTGTTDSTFPSGSGSFYASTFATFRVIDKTYGTEVSGATITGYAVESTNPVEWLANIFGAAWGGKIIGSEVNAVTDENGVASFMMFTNVRYSLTLSHPDLPNDVTRTFALSALSTEYPWYVDIPHEKDPTAQTSITTTATVSGDGLINITYNDASKTTSLVTVNVWKKDDENNYTTLMDTTTALGNANTIQLQLTDFSGADVKISVLFTTSAFGTVERVYYHTFPGPWFDLGLPASIYIWICLLTAILLGGISPFINSYACCFVICFMEWVYWAFGWFFQIGQPVAAFLLTCATVLSIAYYIASRR